jgi:FSR family fosmidomycin resistance protein-like MFS transporter
MGALAGAHLTVDICQGAVPALLPFLIADRGISYASASLLLFAATLSSSIVQPLFGYYSDRRPLPWLIPLGVLTGAAGIAAAGLVGSYGFTFVAIFVSGFGVAAFHPEGSRFANYVSGARRATGMSMFSLGGNLGFALGPILITPAVLAFGLSGTLVVLIPNCVVALVLIHEMPRLRSFVPPLRSVADQDSAAPEHWRPFCLLVLVIGCRSCVYFGLLAFLPEYLIHVQHDSKATGDAALSVMLVGGAVGTVIGGRLADRIGRRPVLMGTMVLMPPLILAFMAVGGFASLLMVFLVGAVTVATFSVTVVMGQEFLPGRIGIASGVTLGFSIGLGGVIAPLLGVLSDASGLRTTLSVVAAVPVLGFLLTLLLPSGRRAAARV